MNDVYAGRMSVHSFVCSFVRLFAMKCIANKTAGPRSANFCVPMHVDKVRSPAIFIQIVSVFDLHLKVKDSNRVHC